MKTKSCLLLTIAGLSCSSVLSGLGAPGAATGTVYEGWPFDASEAVRRQTETAQLTGQPVTRQTPLAGTGGPALTWRLIPAGKYVMGSPSTEPGHEGDEWDPLESTCRHASLSIL